ncbi:hypothetical protein HK098_001011 [Nowakowskiella sp. JEL0407]|nr:hypothetical protein HK098_001011 [Nowakowskiella sp. JEL0407]
MLIPLDCYSNYKVLWDIFIAPSSLFELNISEQTRKSVLEAFENAKRDEVYEFYIERRSVRRTFPCAFEVWSLSITTEITVVTTLANAFRLWFEWNLSRAKYLAVLKGKKLSESKESISVVKKTSELDNSSGSISPFAEKFESNAEINWYLFLNSYSFSSDLAGCGVTIGYPLLLWKIRNVRDVQSIKFDLQGNLWTSIPLLALWAAYPYIPGSDITYRVYFCTFGLLGTHFWNIMLPVFRTLIASQKKIDARHSLTKDTFLETIQNGEKWSAFKEILVKNWSIENGIFIDEYRNLLKKIQRLYRDNPNNFKENISHSESLNSVTKSSKEIKGIRFNNFYSKKTLRSTVLDPPSPLRSSVGSRTTSATKSDGLCVSIEQIDSLRNLMEVIIPQELVEDFTTMYRVFLVEGAPLELNIPFDNRKEVQDKIEARKINLGAFEKVAKEVLENMFSNSFRTFVEIQHAVK